MKKQISYKIVSLVFSILVICFAIAFYVVAWEEPGTPPPSGNVDAPLNTGNIAQDKSGPLRIGGVFRTDSETVLAVLGGNVGIGTTNPSQKLDVRGPVRIDYDASNYDVWIQGGSAPSGAARNLALLGIKSTDELRLNFGGEYTGGVRIAGPKTIIDGNVGIGIITPSEKLDVVGNIIASGTICDSTGCIGSGGGGGLPSCADGQVLKYNFGSSSWECADESGGLAFGNWVDMTAVASGGATQGPAASDGFVVAYFTGGTSAYIEGYTDGSNPPTTMRSSNRFLRTHSDSGFFQSASITMPVKKGHYWRVKGRITKVYWIPIISGGGGGGGGTLSCTTAITTGAQNQTVVAVTCPGGKTVTGGGSSCGGSDCGHLINSSPSGNGWSVEYSKTGVYLWINAYAVCCNIQ